MSGDLVAEFGNTNGAAGTLLREESFDGLDDHPAYMRYLRGEKGEPVNFIRSKIMDVWTNKPLFSEGFTTCYALIATKPTTNESQALHVSLDQWFPTNTEELRKRIDEWNAQQARLILVRAPKSAIGSDEVKQLADQFGTRFIDILLDKDSRFGMVFDTLNRLLLVQMTDTKLLRVYAGFQK